MNEIYEWGTPIGEGQKDSLHPMTLGLIQACQDHPCIEVLDIRTVDEGLGPEQAIVIEAGDGTIESGNPGRIRRRETLAITVNPQTDVPVVVRTLRKDFPGHSHQHGTHLNTPRALCLYNIVWSAVERSWTPERFLERMFWWLRETSQLRLHRDDQPLEQLFYSSRYQLILPSNYLKQSEDSGKNLIIEEITGAPGRQVTLRGRFDDSNNPRGVGLQSLKLSVDGVGSSHVEAAPQTLGQLHDRLVSRGSGLKEPLFSSVFDAVTDQGLVPEQAGEIKAILILVWVPRTGKEGIERYDVLGYALQSSLQALGNAFGMLHFDSEKRRWHRTTLIGDAAQSDEDRAWRDLEILSVQIRWGIGAEGGRQMSAINPDDADFDGVLAGVGSLGGTLADIWLREGWGRWTYIDPDQLLPHNLARHVGLDSGVGYAKVDVVRHHAQMVFPDEPEPKAIAGSLTSRSEEVMSALDSASLVIDATTTFDAPRDLAERENAPRTASVFLTPSGLASVILLEDASRTLRSPALEAQYYRAILNSPWGKSHLQDHLGDLWVGGGCRDISFRIPLERIHLHAAILSKQLRKSVLGDGARICVWTVDEETEAVTPLEITPHPVSSHAQNGWTVTYDDALITKLKQIRGAALPNETGGVLLGVTDLKSKTILLVDTLLPPADSQATPHHFIRGKVGQEAALADVHERTARVVDYVGEWHSHPDGYPATPSVDDRTLITSLADLMSSEGLPAIMIIVGEYEITLHVE